MTECTLEPFVPHGLALPDFLKPSPECGVHWTEEHVHEQLVIDPKGYINYLDQAFVCLAENRLYAEFTPKQILTDRHKNGDFRSMPCVTEREGSTCKTVKIVGTNLAQQKIPGQITVGKAYVLDSIENFITHSVDACLLSSARTGACAVLAVRNLASSDEIAIIGCGRVGFYTALYSLTTLPIHHLYLADNNPEKASQLLRYFNLVAPHVSISIISVAEALMIPVVILATTSQLPIASPDNCSSRLIVSLGADADDQSELTVDWTELHDLEILVDTHDCQRFGDLKAWNTAGRLHGRILTDLISLYRDKCQRINRTLFVSTGSALFDNLTLRYLLKLDTVSSV